MEDITLIQNLSEMAQELINWCIGILAGGGISLATAITFIVKFYGKSAQLKLKQLSLTQKNEELKHAREERDLVTKKLKEQQDALVEYENCTRRAVTAFGTGLTYFINGSRASEECKETANKYFREGFSSLPQISTDEAEEVFERSEMFNAQSKTKRAQAVATVSDSIEKIKKM